MINNLTEWILNHSVEVIFSIWYFDNFFTASWDATWQWFDEHEGKKFRCFILALIWHILDSWRHDVSILPSFHIYLYSLLTKNYKKFIFPLPFQVFDKLLHEKAITNIEEIYTNVSTPPQTLFKILSFYSLEMGTILYFMCFS